MKRNERSHLSWRSGISIGRGNIINSVSNRSHLFYLLLILLLGLLLRLYNLGGESIWYDEAMSILQANRPFMDMLAATAADNHPPLYNICLHTWILLFGDSEFAVRSLSVLFGLLTIFMTYKVSILMFDMEIGLFGALLVAISSFHIQYSQEARMYSLMALFALLSIYFFLLLHKKKTLLTYIGYITSTALLLYTHYLCRIYSFGREHLCTDPMFYHKDNHITLSLKKWILLQSIVIVIFIPWIGILAQ